MKEPDYWRERAAILEEAAHRQGEELARTAEREFRAASRRLQDEIERWYVRVARNNGVSLVEARRLLNVRELEEFRWSVEEYIKRGEENGLDGRWVRQLENASARVHISRLEALELQLQQEIELLYGGQLDDLDGVLRGVYSESYYHTAFEIQRGVRLGWDLQSLDKRRLDAVLSKPWTTDGRTFRDRCWTNKEALVRQVQTSLVQGFIRGDGADRMTGEIAKQMGVSAGKAARLVMTETAYFSARSQQDCFKELGVEQFEVVETLDSHTCDICQGLDGKVLPMSAYEPGVTAPPFHPWCRGCTAPWFPDNFGERAARDHDGETYYVPAEIKYSEWKRGFVDGGGKAGLTAAAAGPIIKLSFDEESALKEYISSGAYKVNPQLRKGLPLTNELNKLVFDLDAALEKLPVYRGKIYRSLSVFDMEDVEAFLASYRLGTIKGFPAYTSAGTVVYDNSFPLQYIIESKAGRDLRNYNPGEMEILFPRGTKFRVTRVDGRTIYMEEV